MPRTKNPSSRSMQEAIAIYKGFHGKEPSESVEIELDTDKIPEHHILIGKVVAIEYEVVGTSDRKGQVFRHEIGDVGTKNPVDTTYYLTTDLSKKNFYLLKPKKGQKYPIFSPRGIIG